MITHVQAPSASPKAHLLSLMLLLGSGCSLFEATPSCVSDEQCAPSERCELGRCELATVMIDEPFVDAQLDLGVAMDRGMRDMDTVDMELEMGLDMGDPLYKPRLESCSLNPRQLDELVLNPAYSSEGELLTTELGHRLSCLNDDLLLFSKPLSQEQMTRAPEEVWLYRSFTREGLDGVFFEALMCSELNFAINPDIITGLSFGVTEVNGERLDQLIINTSTPFVSELSLNEKEWVSFFSLSSSASSAACTERPPRTPVGSTERVLSLAYGEDLNALLMVGVSDTSDTSELMVNAFGHRRQCELNHEGAIFDQWALTVMHNKIAWFSLEDAGSEPEITRATLVLNISGEMGEAHQPRVNVGDELTPCPRVTKRRLGVSLIDLNLQEPSWRARYQMSYDPFSERLSLCVPTASEQECWLYEWSEEGGLKALIVNERPLRVPFAFHHQALGDHVMYVDNRDSVGLLDYQVLNLLEPCPVNEETQVEGERCYQQVDQLQSFIFSEARLMYFRSGEEAPSLYLLWVNQEGSYAVLHSLKL